MPRPIDLWRRINLGRSALPGSPRLDHYVFAFVFLVRLITLARLTSSPFLFPSGGDMHFYDDWARQILHGRFTDHFAFYGLPLYAYLLAFLYRIFGDSPFVPGFLQVCLDAGTATLLYKIAIRIFQGPSEPGTVHNRTRVIGLLAALGWTFFVPAQAYSVTLMPTAWGVFVFWFLLWQITKADHAPSPLRCLTYGALVGITATGTAMILFIVPLLLAAPLLRPRSGQTSRVPWVGRSFALALLFLGIMVGTSPCWIHNCFIARDPVFLSAHSGINFWAGNNPEATGYPNFPGLHNAQAAMLRDSIDLAQAAAGRNLKRSEVSEFWSSKARAYIKSDFGGWLKLMGRKFMNFWSAFEYDDINVIAKLSSIGVVFPGLHFGFVAALAFPGVCLSIGRFPTARWIAVAILLHLAAVLPVFVTERYRIAAAPGLILFAAAGTCIFWDGCALPRATIVARYIAALAAAVVLVTWPQRDPTLWALKFYSSGLQALNLQQWPMAQKQLEVAYAYAPHSTEINLALGNLWLQQQNLTRAKAHYLAVLKMDPRHKAALSNLGVVALEERDWDVAATYFINAEQIAPDDATTHFLLAKAKLGSGDYRTAAIEVERAISLNPAPPEFLALREMIQKLAAPH